MQDTRRECVLRVITCTEVLGLGFVCVLCEDAGLFCEDTGLFCEDIGLFCEDIGLFCEDIGLSYA